MSGSCLVEAGSYTWKQIRKKTLPRDFNSQNEASLKRGWRFMLVLGSQFVWPSLAVKQLRDYLPCHYSSSSTMSYQLCKINVAELGGRGKLVLEVGCGAYQAGDWAKGNSSLRVRMWLDKLTTFQPQDQLCGIFLWIKSSRQTWSFIPSG